MPHLEGVEEGREKAAQLVESNAEENPGPVNEQDNDNCQEGESEHPDYATKDPEEFLDKQEASNADRNYRGVEIHDNYKDDLDDEQKRILEIGESYSKTLVKSLKTKETAI